MSDEERETKPFKFVTAGVDARFPNQNQTKHCWQNYVDYHKCINAKGEDFAPCRQFFLAYRSLCPSGWYQRWDDQRGSCRPALVIWAMTGLTDYIAEAGNFPVKLDA
ncbi:cytochrome c oxidase polypeptide vib-like protein [Xylaria bambusicola]|uniref:cytochrome c oxidase polypeptide vib-like protein n=1 Tax=Xylaria bambusicola TaxID=326684 RepID=UPI002007F005|nr:cytochrome c oxidase polypeptide vib-like protein [Xylaria bambusicola]KAI0512846.1 cytochrome c oxidase polypeptide vib-like protein [Xylaria bambusicola]